MRVCVALWFCGLLSIPLFSQSAKSTFTSQDGVFQFQYSPLLVRCEARRGEGGSPISWVPADACLCDDTDGAATTIACFAYPKDSFKDKPVFSGAAFLVAEVRAAPTPKACLAGSKNWLIKTFKNEKINSVTFKRFITSDAWTSHYEVGDIYRAFHANKCYELAIQEITTNPAAYDPGAIKEFTKQDSDEVRARLKEVLDSFTFLK